MSFMNVGIPPVYRFDDGAPVAIVIGFWVLGCGISLAATRIESRAYLDCADPAQYAESRSFASRGSLRITLNGEPYDLDEPLSVADLLARLAIDPRRVAVEHNLVILRRPLFSETLVHEGDRVEIVNFVGGG